MWKPNPDIEHVHGHQPWLVFTSASDLAFAARTTLAAVAALFTAMWLQLDVPRWAMWTVLIVSPPVRGNALRKTAARVIGTLIGCGAGVTAVALFPQDRVGFYVTFSLWLGACAYWATLQQGYVSYAATLAAFTSAIISANVSTTPYNVWETAVARGSATVLGIVFAYFASAIAARSDDVPAELAKRIRSLAVDLLDWAARQVETGNSGGSRDAALTARILGLHEADINGVAERRALAWVKPWIVGLPTALLSLQSAVLSLRESARRGRASSADTRLAGDALSGAGDFLRTEAALELPGLRRQSDALAARSGASDAEAPVVKRIIDALAYLLAGLEAILSRRPPSRAVPTFPAPEFVAQRRRASINFLRTVVGMFVGFMVWDVTAWAHGPIFLVNIAVALVLFVRLEDPVAGNMQNVIGTLMGGIVALIVKYVVLIRENDPLVLLAVLFLLIFVGAWLETKPKLSALGLFYMNGLLILIEPRNPQTYPFVDELNTLIALTLAYAFTSLVFLAIQAPRSGRERILELLIRMRQLRWLARYATSRARQLGWETRMYDELQRLQAATGDPKRHELGVSLLLSGLRNLPRAG